MLEEKDASKINEAADATGLVEVIPVAGDGNRASICAEIDGVLYECQDFAAVDIEVAEQQLGKLRSEGISRGDIRMNWQSIW